MRILSSSIRLLLCWLVTIGCAFIAIGGSLLLLRPSITSWTGRRIWGPVLLRILGVKLTVRVHPEINFDKPIVFFMNHQSTIDILVAFAAIPSDVYFVAKKELKWLPFVGWAMQAGGMIFVDRSSPKKAIESMRAAAEEVRNGKNIVAYPEGTRSRDGRPGSFKKGAFVTAMQAQVDCVPMAVHGAFEVMGPSVFNIKPGPVFLQFGAPISTEGLNHSSNQDRVGLTQQGEAAVMQMFQELKSTSRLSS